MLKNEEEELTREEKTGVVLDRVILVFKILVEIAATSLEVINFFEGYSFVEDNVN